MDRTIAPPHETILDGMAGRLPSCSLGHGWLRDSYGLKLDGWVRRSFLLDRTRVNIPFVLYIWDDPYEF